MGLRITLVIGITLLLSFFCFNSGFCDEKKAIDDNFDSVEALINLLKEKGVVSEEEAARFIQRSGKRTVPEAGKQGVITIIPEEYIEKITKNVVKEIKKDIKDEITRETRQLVPGWVNRIRWGGDIRLRYQNEFYDEQNADLLKPDKPAELMNTKKDQRQFNYRVRLKINARINDNLEFSARLSTGTEENPISTNEMLGDYNTSDSIVFDRAYLKWKPIPEISVWGGRIPNPWFCSDLIWDPDLNFEGVALNLDTHIAGPLSGFMAAGAFPLQEKWSQNNKWLYGGQAGLQLSLWKDVKSKVPGVTAKIGAAYYDYENTVGERNDALSPNEKDWTAPQFQQKGNTLFYIDPSSDYKLALASEYDELNITGTLDIGFFHPVHVVFLADYVKNLGFNRNEVADRIGKNPDVIKKEIEGYQAGLNVGYPKVRKSGEWNAFLFYKHLEADAVFDAFTDSDFHLGGTNAKGWILGVRLGLRENWWLRTRWLTADEIEGPALAIDVLQVDINAAF